MNQLASEILIRKRHLRQFGFAPSYVYLGRDEICTAKQSNEFKLNLNHYDTKTKKIGGRFFFVD